jgi:hypothetical protein
MIGIRQPSSQSRVCADADVGLASSLDVQVCA